VSFHLAVDVHYQGDGRAVAAGVAFADWRSDVIARTEVVRLGSAQPYEPGHFFKRELPHILELVDRFPKIPATIVIDGYVTLGVDQRDGLGARLFSALQGQVPVIGVAKSRFVGTPAETGVLRGRSRRPLYVTSRGIALEGAKRLIRDMHGVHRLPTLLVAVDRACRELDLMSNPE
jgi:deoxyribonuclease V